jgi:hypothetical protein
MLEETNDYLGVRMRIGTQTGSLIVSETRKIDDAECLVSAHVSNK